MSTSTTTPNIIYYHYPHSPYARKVFWYLRLRAIPFKQCLQPMILPRPDLSTLLGITYRRIPLLTIDSEVYIDTHLIISTLEKLFPAPLPGSVFGAAGGASNPWTQLLEGWSDVVFPKAVMLLPVDLPVMKSVGFVRDRKDYSGGGAFDREKMIEQRPEALAAMRNYFTFVEHTLLSGGKKWVLGGDQPSLADLMAIFPLDWIITIPNALKTTNTSPHGSELFNSTVFPSLYSWHSRFKSLLTLPTLPPPPASLKGVAARDLILSSPTPPEPEFDLSDPLNLVKREWVTITPTDSGKNYPQRGRLVGLDVQKAVLEVDVPGVEGEKKIRVVFPRLGYAIKRDTKAVEPRL